MDQLNSVRSNKRSWDLNAGFSQHGVETSNNRRMRQDQNNRSKENRDFVLFRINYK